MKIAFFCANDYGKIVGEELIERGHEVTFNTLSNETELTFVFGAPTTFKFNMYLNQRYDVERFIYTGKIVCVVFDLPLWRFRNLQWKPYYNNYKKLLSRAHHLVTISKQTTEQLKDIWGLNSKPLFTIFNDKLVDKYKKVVPRKKQIIMVSRFVPHKRFDLVMRAIEGTDWKLIMCGRSGSHTDYYRGLAESLNINYEMHINPDDKFVIEKYCESAVCIQPSIFEGLSLVPKEALWCDTSVILSDTLIHREFHANNVDYFKPDDIDSLKKVLNMTLKTANKEHLENLRIKNVTNEVEKWLKATLIGP